jgi:hypothetical protein
MKSYQHSDKSEELKGVAGLNCVWVTFSPLPRIFRPPFALPLDGWMDAYVCMQTRIYLRIVYNFSK